MYALIDSAVIDGVIIKKPHPGTAFISTDSVLQDVYII